MAVCGNVGGSVCQCVVRWVAVCSKVGWWCVVRWGGSVWQCVVCLHRISLFAHKIWHLKTKVDS